MVALALNSKLLSLTPNPIGFSVKTLTLRLWFMTRVITLTLLPLRVRVMV